MNLIATSTRNYKKNGNTVFVYTFLNLSPEKKAVLKSVQKDFYREDEAGNPLWFTTRYSGDKVDVVANEQSGKLYADTSKLDKAASLAKQYGGNLGQELAKISAAQLLGVAPQPESISIGSDIEPQSGSNHDDLDKM